MFRTLGEKLGLVAPRQYNVHVDRGYGLACIAGPYMTLTEATGHRDRLAKQDNPETKYLVMCDKGVVQNG